MGKGGKSSYSSCTINVNIVSEAVVGIRGPTRLLDGDTNLENGMRLLKDFMREQRSPFRGGDVWAQTRMGWMICLLACDSTRMIYIQAISEQTSIIQRSDAIRFLSAQHSQRGTPVH